MKIRQILNLALTGLVVACGLSDGRMRAAEEAHRLNVLFLISDDLTGTALHCYGNSQTHTPHLDRLAARGIRFTRAFCQYPVCGPARACLMSGLYAQSIGVTGNGMAGRFTENMGDRPTLPECFRRAGWFTARVSKIYHMRVPGDITAGVDGPDHAASWVQRYNCQAPEWMTHGQAEHLTNERLRFEPDKHYGLGFGTAFYVVKGEGSGAEQADAKAAARAIELLRAHRDEPFFLAVGLVRPHVPLVAPESFFVPYPPDDMRLPKRIPNDWDDIPKAGISKNSRSIGLEGHLDRQRKVLSAYYAAVSFMDHQVGRILRALDELGLTDRTLVVFTSDHGYHLGEHDFWQKMSLHEESARVPLILAGPGIEPSVTDALAQAIDLYPTLAELAGLPVPSHCQGRSLVPVIRNPTRQVHDAVYCFRSNGHLLRTPRWAYLRYPKSGEELYDMSADPHQFTNLVQRAAYADVLEKMRLRLDRQLESIASTQRAR